MEQSKELHSRDLHQKICSELTSRYEAREAYQIAFLLLEHYLDLSKNDLITNKTILLEADTGFNLTEAISQLQKGTPIQYVLGESIFYGIKFRLNKHTLIPRPETEELVDLILKEYMDTPDLTIWDIGTGSGCISITLAKHLLNAYILAQDISENALDMVKKNAYDNRVKIQLLNQDILDQNISLPDKKFDIIVSNPPYVRNLEKKEMDSNVLDYEPHSALFVDDNDPLIFYRIIGQRVFNHLHQNGKLFFEINEYLGTETKALIEELGYKNVVLYQDLEGKDRFIVAEKH